MSPHRRWPGPAPTLALLCGLAFAASPAPAAEALVAVAANFADAMETLERDFEAAGEHRLTVVVGSTGKLYAQIVHGAPFDVFLAADSRRPRELEERGLAVPGSRRAYAVGRLVLIGADPRRLAGDGAAVLREGAFRSLAVANPELAPYGAAAVETLRALGVWQRVRGRIVRAENVGQAWAMVTTGNAELGFAALSQLGVDPAETRALGYWIVPETLHAPVRQEAVLLARAAQNEAARAFLRYLHGAGARAAIERLGYAVD